jgi:hypothetical protein
MKLQEAKMVSYGIEKDAVNIQMELHRHTDLMERNIEKTRSMTIRCNASDQLGPLGVEHAAEADAGSYPREQDGPLHRGGARHLGWVNRGVYAYLICGVSFGNLVLPNGLKQLLGLRVVLEMVSHRLDQLIQNPGDRWFEVSRVQLLILEVLGQLLIVVVSAI